MEVVNILSMLVVTLLSICPAVDPFRDQKSLQKSSTVTNQQLHHRRQVRPVAYFLSAAAISGRRLRVRRSASDETSLDHFGQSEVVFSLLDEDDGSGSVELELTPVNEVIRDRSFSADWNSMGSTTTQISILNSTKSTVETRGDHYAEVTSSSSDFHTSRESMGTSQYAASGSFDSNREHSKTDTVLDTQTVVLVTSHSLGDSTEDDRQQNANSADIPVSDSVAETDVECDEESVLPSIKAWTIVILTVLGTILLCVAVVVSIRRVVANKRKARLQWSTDSNGSSNPTASSA